MKVIDTWGESYEKHLGDDEHGQPMIWVRYVDHAWVRFERDIRPEVQDKDVGWWDTQQEPVPGSDLSHELNHRFGITQQSSVGVSKIHHDGTKCKVTYRGLNTGGPDESPRDWVGENDGLPF